VELLAEAFEPADDVIVDDVGDEQVDLEAPVVVEDARIGEQALDGIAERDRAGPLTVNDGVVTDLADRGPELPVLRVIPGQLGLPCRDQPTVWIAHEAEAEIVRRSGGHGRRDTMTFTAARRSTRDASSLRNHDRCRLE
jgi:hypothetical protein